MEYHELRYTISILRLKIPHYVEQRRDLQYRCRSKRWCKKQRALYSQRLYWKNRQIKSLVRSIRVLEKKAGEDICEAAMKASSGLQVTTAS